MDEIRRRLTSGGLSAGDNPIDGGREAEANGATTTAAVAAASPVGVAPFALPLAQNRPPDAPPANVPLPDEKEKVDSVFASFEETGYRVASQLRTTSDDSAVDASVAQLAAFAVASVMGAGCLFWSSQASYWVGSFATSSPVWSGIDPLQPLLDEEDRSLRSMVRSRTRSQSRECLKRVLS